MNRPLPVLVFGIFNAAYGVLCLCLFVVGYMIWFMSLFIDATPPPNPNIPEDVFEASAADWLYAILSTPISIGLSIMLITSGTGILGGKQWAWSVSLLYAKLGAIYTLFTSLYWTAYMWTNWDDFILVANITTPGLSPQMFDMMWEWIVRMLIIVTLVQLLHCALLHLYMKTDRVVAWFEAADWDGDDGLGREDV